MSPRETAPKNPAPKGRHKPLAHACSPLLLVGVVFLSRYHLQSNIESTFSMIKRKFGDSVRSKTDVATKNEVLARLVCHNICCLIQAMYENGVDPAFWAEKAQAV
jgi:hypothetical protein